MVFVVDSSSRRLEDNRESFQELKELLEKSGRPDVPIVVQYNKRDLPDALPISELSKKLGLQEYPYVEAEAFEGKGVLETFVLIAKQSLKYFYRNYMREFEF